MKILLTGQPHSGKSTLLSRLVANIDNKQGFLTREVINSHKPGERVGFELISAHGNTATLAHMDSNSDIRVSKYGVETDSLDAFLSSLQDFKDGQLLYLDEVGQMQLNSVAFQDLARKYMATKNDFIGTITAVYEHEFVEEAKSAFGIELIEVTPDNRDELYEALIPRLQAHIAN